jgi:hypothetical protein
MKTRCPGAAETALNQASDLRRFQSVAQLLEQFARGCQIAALQMSDDDVAGVYRRIVAGDWWLLQARVPCYHDEMPALFTIGYEGCAIAEVLATLKRARIKLLIDVRALPRSRKPGFSKRQLAAALDEHSIRYVHLQALGTPKPGRDAARAGHPERMEVIFRAHMEGDRPQAELADATALARRERSCLLCFEHDPMQCHRRIVAEMMVAKTGQRVTHLHTV